MKETFTGRMVRIHFGGDDRWQGSPLLDAILARCKELGIAQATVYRGLEGYGAGSRTQRNGHWTFSKNAPIELSIVDAEAKIARLLPFLDAMLEEGIVETAPVEVIRYSRPGTPVVESTSPDFAAFRQRNNRK